jgi:hypothetical protein
MLKSDSLAGLRKPNAVDRIAGTEQHEHRDDSHYARMTGSRQRSRQRTIRDSSPQDNPVPLFFASPHQHQLPRLHKISGPQSI